jgi:hypothetical protein
MGEAITDAHDAFGQCAPGTGIDTAGAGRRKREGAAGKGIPPAHASTKGGPVIRFPLGQVVATPGALRALEKAEQLPAEFLDRHVNGDWGDVPEADKQENELSVEQGFRILSVYTTSAGDQIWILTEADRSATTIMLPSEY